MRFRQIEVFHAIMETGTVSAAAQRLGVSQPSVTKTLQLAEQELGYALFDRVKGRLQPTEEARALYQESARAYAALDGVRDLSRRLRLGVDGLFRVAATPSLGLEVLPDAVAAYLSDHPKARFELTTRHSGDLLASLGQTADGLDLGFTFGAQNAPAGLTSVELGEVSLACVAPKGWFGGAQGAASLSDLAGAQIVGLEETEPLGKLLADRLRALGGVYDPVVQVQTYQFACALAARTGMLAVVDAMTAMSFADGSGRGRVDVRPLAVDERLPVTAVYPLSRGLPIAMRSLVDRFQAALEARNEAFRALATR